MQTLEGAGSNEFVQHVQKQNQPTRERPILDRHADPDMPAAAGPVAPAIARRIVRLAMTREDAIRMRISEPERQEANRFLYGQAHMTPEERAEADLFLAGSKDNVIRMR